MVVWRAKHVFNNPHMNLLLSTSKHDLSNLDDTDKQNYDNLAS